MMTTRISSKMVTMTAPPIVPPKIDAVLLEEVVEVVEVVIGMAV